MRPYLMAMSQGASAATAQIQADKVPLSDLGHVHLRLEVPENLMADALLALQCASQQKARQWRVMVRLILEDLWA
jgi:hypothetical protein